MSFTAVKKANGSSLIASNTVLAADGGSHAVSNDVLNAAAAGFTVFAATVEVNPIQVVNFRLADSVNRMFRL